MQRYGPPPSYPNLKIPGLNARIPEGAQWGFHPGGWGKPPVDEYQRPLYGDVFGLMPKNPNDHVGPVDKTLWGELEPDEEEEEEDEDESDEEETARPEAPVDGLQTPSGLETPSGFASITSTVPGGLETPDFIELRKRREVAEVEDEGPKQLYQVIPEKKTAISGLMGSERGYDLAAVTGNAAAPPVLGQEERGTKRKASGVDVSLDASELEGLSEAELRTRYEAGRQQGVGTKESFADYVAEESKKRQKTAEAKRGDRGSKRDFKF